MAQAVCSSSPVICHMEFGVPASREKLWRILQTRTPTTCKRLRSIGSRHCTFAYFTYLPQGPIEGWRLASISPPAPCKPPGIVADIPPASVLSFNGQSSKSQSWLSIRPDFVSGHGVSIPTEHFPPLPGADRELLFLY